MIERIIEASTRNKAVVLMLFAAAIIAAVWCVRNVPLDAIPDLSDTQVIIYSQWDRSPDIIEEQVTYPIVTAYAWCAEGKGDARLFGLRLLLST